MTVLITLLALVELTLFLAYDLRHNRNDWSKRYVIRLMSSAGGIFLLLSDFLLHSSVSIWSLTLDLAFVTSVLVFYPCSFEKPDTSFKVSICLLVFGYATLVRFGFKSSGGLAFKGQRIVSSFVPMLLFVLSYFLYTAYRRFSGIRAMFRNTAVWHGVEEYSRFLYSIAFLTAGMIFLCAATSAGHYRGFLSAVSLLMFLALYAVLYLRAMTGRTFVLNRSTEKRIKDIIKGNLRTSYAEKEEDDRKMSNLYRRVTMFMEEKKPYLDHTFDMSSLADQMFTNKVYLSKTINILSGRNFRQFVNYYRVQKAIELFKEDPRLKISEVSEMSGFNSSVTFNMSFKVNTGKTPSEWLQAYTADLLK